MSNMIYLLVMPLFAYVMIRVSMRVFARQSRSSRDITHLRLRMEQRNRRTRKLRQEGIPPTAGEQSVTSGCTCQECGRVYKVDFIVPDALWAEIRPNLDRPEGAGLMCPRCIAAAIEGRGKFDAFFLSTKPQKTKGETR